MNFGEYYWNQRQLDKIASMSCRITVFFLTQLCLHKFIFLHCYQLFVLFPCYCHPKRTWREVVQKDCQACSLNREDAMDHSRWKKLIKVG